MTTPDADGRIVTFYSYKGGAGRSMALANIAWLLASGGQRVLVVDWDLEAPGVHRYFHPFLPDPELRALPGIMDMVWDFAVAMTSPENPAEPDWFDRRTQITSYAASLTRSFPQAGTLDFVSAGRHDATYSYRVSTFDWSAFYTRLDGGSFIDALRESMRASYDWILIDSRTGLSDTAGICTVELPDILVNCFTLNTQCIEGAVSVATSARDQRTERPLRVLPVPVRVEEAEKAKLEISRDYARARFTGFLDHVERGDHDRYWGDVEVPYKPFYAYEETLAVFGDRPHQSGTLLAAYERIAAWLTDGAVTALPPADDRSRRRDLALFERTPSGSRPGVVVSHVPPDRYWAEWVSAELRSMGVRATLADIGPGQLDPAASLVKTRHRVAIVSADYLRRQGARAELTQDRPSLDTDRGERPTTLMRIEPIELPDGVGGPDCLDLFELTEGEARVAVGAAFGARARVDLVKPRDDGALPRYPGNPAQLWRHVPARNIDFTGRERLLRAIRDAFTDNGPSPATVVLHGLGGVGKTQLAAEYAHRFGAAYDLVCWLNCDQLSLARSSLAGLAPALALRVSRNTDPADQVLDALRTGRPFRRWLLVCDNAEDPVGVGALIPPGPGHVLITSRTRRWVGARRRLEVSVFERPDSIEFLRRRAPGLASVDADRLAEALGDMPLALEHAGVWQEADTGTSVDRYLELLQSRPGPLLAEGDIRSYPRPVARAWTLSLERLREQTPLAADLAELCAFLGPEPISLSLFAGPGLGRLDTPEDQRLRDEIKLSAAVGALADYALVRVDAANGSLQMHRIVQAVIRDELPDEQRLALRRRVHNLLVAADPGDPDDPATWPRYAAVRPHVWPSHLPLAAMEKAAKLIENIAQALYRQYAFGESGEFARDVVDQWHRSRDPDSLPTLRLQLLLADGLRATGEAAEARALDQEVHARLSRMHGARYALTLRAARSLAGDLRGLGEYAEARALDENTYVHTQETLGREHLESLMAANNLAVSMRFSGDFTLARDLTRDTYAVRRRIRGETEQYTLQLADSYARDLRECGHLDESLELARQTWERYRDAVGPDHLETLRSMAGYAVALRRAGQTDEGLRFSTLALGRFRVVATGDYPDALTAAVAHVVALSAAGQHASAVSLAERTLERSTRRFGAASLYSAASENAVAIAARGGGDARRAAAYAERALATITTVLGAQHPFTLAAMVNRANCYYDLGEWSRARDLDQRAHGLLSARLGSDHPSTLVCGLHLALDLIATSERASGEALALTVLRDSQRRLGTDHPITRTIGRRERRDLDIDLPPP